MLHPCSFFNKNAGGINGSVGVGKWLLLPDFFKEFKILFNSP
jgi:hypothetical protein